MNFHILRHAAWLALLGAAATSACTSDAPPPSTFVTSFIQGAAGLATLCDFQSQTPWINIGVPTGNDPTVVGDGSTQGGGKVTAACTVHPVGGGFDINLNASLSGEGSITISSPMGMGAVTVASGGTGITGTFQKVIGRYTSTDCTLTFTYGGPDTPVPRTPPIAAGRVWGHISCPDAQRSDEMRLAPDGGMENGTCDTEADFLFEFCNE